MQRASQVTKLARRIPQFSRRAASSQPIPRNDRYSPSNLLYSFFAIAVGVAMSEAVHRAYPAAPVLPPNEKDARSRPFATDFQGAITELRAVFPDDQVSTLEDDLILHGVSSNSHHPPANPAVICYPLSTEDVVKVVNIARKYRMPVTPFSGGTSLESHCSAPFGGLCLDLSRMNKILAIHAEDGDLVCQSGAGWMEINEELQEQGIPLFFPLDPGPGATIGGMIGTGCSGTNAMRYGTAKAEWFLNATVVLANGEVIKTRSRARKSSAGFDLTKLFIGAEGTLGIVTEATIRLTPLLPTRVAICNFPTVKQAVDCVIDCVSQGVPLQCVELLDTVSVQAVNNAGLCPFPLEVKESIWFKLQGEPAATELAVAQIEKILKKHNGGALKFAKDQEESNAIWHARKALAWSMLGLRPGFKMYSTDVCVPLSELPTLVADTRRDFDENKIFGSCLGHAADGNFHASILFEHDSEFPQVDAAAHRMVERAIELGGTCTGEHGVGSFKRGYLKKELGEGTVEVMQSIKNLLDPTGIMNPGKLYPDVVNKP